MANKEKFSKWLTLDPVTGKVQSAKRFAGGSFHALKRSPRSLRKPDSYYCKILRVMAESKTKLNTTAIKDAYNKTYNESKTHPSVNARLSELSALQIIEHFDDPNNKGGGFWAIKPGIDIHDNEALYKLAESNRIRLLANQ